MGAVQDWCTVGQQKQHASNMAREREEDRAVVAGEGGVKSLNRRGLGCTVVVAGGPHEHTLSYIRRCATARCGMFMWQEEKTR